jgi:hypothetical protein
LGGCQAIAGLDAPLSPPGDASVGPSDARAGQDASGDGLAPDASAAEDGASNSDGNTSGCDAAADRHNCGACGHDCLGGDCVDGQCQPVTILAGQSHPIDIGVDDAATPPSVFFLNVGSANAMPPYGDGGVFRVAVDNGGNTKGRITLASSDGTRVGQPACLVLGAFSVYFTNQQTGAVLSIPKTGGALQTIRDAVPSSPALGLAIDESPSAPRAFWTEPATHHVVKRFLYAGADSGSEDVLFTAGDVPWAIAIDGKTAYFEVRASEEVLSIPRLGCRGLPDGGCANQLVLGSDLEWGCKAIALDGNSVYYKDGSGGGAGIFRALKDGGTTPTTNPRICATQAGPAHIAVANGYVYWTVEASMGGVYRYRTDLTGNVETLASNQSYPRGIAVDGQAVYWVNQGSISPTSFVENNLLNAFDNADGTVMKVALPP